MLYTKKESLEDKIVRYLTDSNKTIYGIKEGLKREKNMVTDQGIYKSIRLLIKEEVVIKNKDIFSLNEEWKNKIIEGFQKNIEFELSEKEQIQFDLSSLIHLDQQWKNITISIQKNISGFPVFFYNPHDIWSFLSESRKQSEISYYKNLYKNKTYSFCVNAGNTKFDKIMRQERETEYNRININDELFKNTDYITIIGDYITIVRISKKTAELIERNYKESKDYQDFQKQIQKLGIEKKKVKLIIEKNKQKAKTLRKKLSKNLYIPKDLIEKYDLF